MRKNRQNPHSRHTVRLSMNCASRTCTTRTSTTRFKCAATAGPSQFSGRLNHSAPIIAQRRACQRQCPQSTSCNCGMSTVSTDCPRELAGPAQQRSITLSMNCNWRISVVYRTVETMRIACVTTGMSTTLTTKTAHLALHNNGHVKPGPRTAPGESLRSAARLHCGNTSLEHNRKVHHSVDELIRGTSTKRNCWNLSLRGHRDVQTGELRQNAARPAPPLSGNPLWSSRAPP